MATSAQPYLACVKSTLTAALCLQSFACQDVERHNRPEVLLHLFPLPALSPFTRLFALIPHSDTFPFPSPYSLFRNPTATAPMHVCLCMGCAACQGDRRMKFLPSPHLHLCPFLHHHSPLLIILVRGPFCSLCRPLNVVQACFRLRSGNPKKCS